VTFPTIASIHPCRCCTSWQWHTTEKT